MVRHSETSDERRVAVSSASERKEMSDQVSHPTVETRKSYL